VSGYIQRQRETIAKLVEQAEQLRSDLAAVTAERDAWRAAMGRFGPQSPAEVAVFRAGGYAR
jgi:hypothetical protein